MRNGLSLIMMVFVLLSCKNDKPPAGDDKVVVNDFIASFSPLKLPFSVSDTTVDNLPDTTEVAYNIVAQFLPDSVFNKPFGKDRKLNFYPIGKFGAKNKEVYLTALVKSKTKSAVYLFVLTRKNIFSSSLPLLVPDNDAFVRTATVDSRLTISLQKEWKENDEILFSRSVYAYNDAGLFTIVMTETNDQSNLTGSIHNPLDTLASKNKFSGDYVKGSLNFLSIRDGKTPDSYLFFVHFENEGPDPCEGELKGGFSLNSPTTGIFSQSGDQCVIDFSFSGNQAKVKEQGNCGSHRGIKCFFNDTYTRKKAPKAAAKEPPVRKKK